MIEETYYLTKINVQPNFNKLKDAVTDLTSTICMYGWNLCHDGSPTFSL